MKPKEQGGSDDIENAIPVCFDCHADIHLYHDKHPRGRKYRTAELQMHRKLWLQACAQVSLADAIGPVITEVGPLHALIDELEFNECVKNERDCNLVGCPFEVRQFDRAVESGSVSLLRPEVKEPLYACYVHLKRANEKLRRAVYTSNGAQYATAITEAQNAILRSGEMITTAKQRLLGFLSSDRSDEDPYEDG